MERTTLVEELNSLLNSLNLPFTLLSPTDLTPSLLLAILQSILGTRIPIDPTTTTDSTTRNIQTIKIFLGVLETDILQTDVGLSKIDPRRLAEGAWDEVVSIAEILCWIGRETGLIPRRVSSSTDPLSPLASSPAPPHLPQPPPTDLSSSPSSSITFLPPFSTNPSEHTSTTHTSLLFTEETTPVTYTDTDTLQPSPIPPRPGAPLPTTPSSDTRTLPPIRRTGYISLVDHDSELSTYLSRSLNLTSRPLSPQPLPAADPRTPPPCRGSRTQQDWLTLISESPEYDPRRTLQLLQDRTRLMEELIRLRMSRSSTR